MGSVSLSPLPRDSVLVAEYRRLVEAGLLRYDDHAAVPNRSLVGQMPQVRDRGVKACMAGRMAIAHYLVANRVAGWIEVEEGSVDER